MRIAALGGKGSDGPGHYEIGEIGEGVANC
jgi:hypothetical protein